MSLLTFKMNYNGYMKFLFIANRFCLDLVNTVVASCGEELDLLTDTAQVSVWLDAQGLSLSESMTESDFEQLKELRVLIRKWVLRKEQGASEVVNGLIVLNRYLGQQPVVNKLTVNEGEFSFQALGRTLSPQGLLSKVATDFANLLVAGELAQVRQCSADRCILIFLDTSKSKRRCWCSMKGCGNRAKASAFYRSRRMHI